MTYALGRGMQPYDNRTINEITKAVDRRRPRFQTLIYEVVSSLPFQSRRGELVTTRVKRTQNKSEGDCQQMITKKTLPRRTFLRGMGSAAIALAVSGCHGPRFNGEYHARRGARPHGFLLCAEWHDHGRLESRL